MGWSDWGSYLLVAVLLLLIMASKVGVLLWWRPRKVERHFQRQGIRGPAYRFFTGNLKEIAALTFKASSLPMTLSHDILPRVLPFYHHWKHLYGDKFLIWFGPTPRVAVSDPSLIREILFSESFEKYDAHPFLKELEGDSLLNLKGHRWAHHRRIISPSFHLKNLNLMIPAVAKSVEEMLGKWRSKSSQGAAEEAEINVSEWFESLTEEIITRTAFGCSYEDGRGIFKLQTQQMAFATGSFTGAFIPGYRFLPTQLNRRRWKIDREIRRSLTRIIDARIGELPSDAAERRPADMLGLMIDAHLRQRRGSDAGASPITVDDIIEECKGFFFAGKGNTSSLLTWTTLLLAMHPQWQQAARDEVLRVCGARDVPTHDDVRSLKNLGMILNESLRLYPPTVAMIRRSKHEVRLGGSRIPGGTELLLPILAVHHDRELWGTAAAEFDPMRFAHGPHRAANHPKAFVPFGQGPRRCLGQNLVLLQAKVAIAMILRRFSFRLSPRYHHAPTVLMLLHPQHGAPILFRPLENPSPRVDDGGR